MAEDTKSRSPSQPKKQFVIRDTPVWLDRHQTWISDKARSLYRTFWSLADQKTGRLFVAGHGWIPPKAVERKSGMCEETRLKYQAELLRLGLLSVHRDYVVREIDGRTRKVLGPAQITVTRPSMVKPHEMRASTTPGNHKSKKSPPKTKGSTTPGKEPDPGKGGLPHPESSRLEETGSQNLKPHHEASPVGPQEGLPPKVPYQGGPGQTPPQNPERDWRTIPSWNLIELTPSEKDELAKDTLLVSTWLELVEGLQAVKIQVDRFTLPNLFENTYQRLSTKGHKVSRLFIEGKIRAKARKAQLVKKWQCSAEWQGAAELAAQQCPRHTEWMRREQERRDQERRDRDQWRRQYEATIKLADERNAKWLAEERAKCPHPSDAEIERAMKLYSKLLSNASASLRPN